MNNEDYNMIRVYFNSIPYANKKLLTPEEEKNLGKILKRNKKRNKSAYIRAKNRLLMHNQGLVIDIAKRYTNRGLFLMDLIQEGNIGLMRAIDEYDYRKGWKFGTYATWWIRQAITRALIDQTRDIRVPVYMVDSLNRLKKKQREMEKKAGLAISVYEAAEELKIPRKKIDLWLSWSQDTVSLSAPVFKDDEDATVEDFIASDNGDPLKILERNKTTEWINKTLRKLSKTEEKVIRMRFGIGVKRDYTLRQIGDMLNISKEAVRQIEAKALRKLRHPTRLRLLKNLR